MFSGLFGALLYALSCREPLSGTHELYVAAKWRQVVGSTMHCVAGDGIGILAAAVIISGRGLPMWAGVLCEYAFGFVFGWSVFQALFMKSMFGSYWESLTHTFISELLSMNAVMGGMTAVMVPWMTGDMHAMSPSHPEFWFVMSIALCAGFLVALPMNWWLVEHGLKHGMMTVRRDNTPVPQVAALALAAAAMSGQQPAHPSPRHDAGSAVIVPDGGGADSPVSPTEDLAAGHTAHLASKPASRRQLAVMTVVSFLVYGAGFLIAGMLGDLAMHH